MSKDKKLKNNKIDNLDQMELMDGISYDEGMDLFGAHKTREQI